MNTDKLYESLDSKKDPDAKRGELILYLKDIIKGLSDDDSERSEIAYDIAGLLSTNYAQTLNDEDVIENILTLAGELEVISSNNDQKWVTLVDLINNL